MKNSLYKWLEERWKTDNHPKYHHLFHDWIKNITPDQVEGFNKQEEKRNIYGN
jgi:hypothetical protein